MIPTSLSAACLFIALVAPGAIFEFTSNQYRHPSSSSTFAEVVRVILRSAVFLLPTSLSVIILSREWILDRIGQAQLADLTVGNTLDLALFALASVAVACLLSWLWATVQYRGPTKVSTVPALFRALKVQPRVTSSDPYLEIQLTDGSGWRGFLDTLDLAADSAERYISMSKGLKRRSQNSKNWMALAAPRTIVIREDQISLVQVFQLSKNKTGNAPQER